MLINLHRHVPRNGSEVNGVAVNIWALPRYNELLFPLVCNEVVPQLFGMVIDTVKTKSDNKTCMHISKYLLETKLGENRDPYIIRSVCLGNSVSVAQQVLVQYTKRTGSSDDGACRMLR